MEKEKKDKMIINIFRLLLFMYMMLMIFMILEYWKIDEIDHLKIFKKGLLGSVIAAILYQPINYIIKRFMKRNK
ncbi:hypothetical protein ACFLTI_03895 [Bacteroidota bacterium]